MDAFSEEEFVQWLNNKTHHGHPWEVCRGGNSTHISLYVYHDEDGFELTLAGSARTRTIETVLVPDVYFAPLLLLIAPCFAMGDG